MNPEWLQMILSNTSKNSLSIGLYRLSSTTGFLFTVWMETNLTKILPYSVDVAQQLDALKWRLVFPGHWLLGIVHRCRTALVKLLLAAHHFRFVLTYFPKQEKSWTVDCDLLVIRSLWLHKNTTCTKKIHMLIRCFGVIGTPAEIERSASSFDSLRFEDRFVGRRMVIHLSPRWHCN